MQSFVETGSVVLQKKDNNTEKGQYQIEACSKHKNIFDYKQKLKWKTLMLRT